MKRNCFARLFLYGSRITSESLSIILDHKMIHKRTFPSNKGSGPKRKTDKVGLMHDPETSRDLIWREAM
jgi:hypothetical protein